MHAMAAKACLRAFSANLNCLPTAWKESASQANSSTVIISLKLLDIVAGLPGYSSNGPVRPSG
jgi:hypothetical protein